MPFKDSTKQKLIPKSSEETFGFNDDFYTKAGCNNENYLKVLKKFYVYV